MAETINSSYEKALKTINESPEKAEEVFALLQEAYSQGSAEAAYAIGSWYLHGKHVDRDISKAANS